MNILKTTIIAFAVMSSTTAFAIDAASSSTATAQRDMQKQFASYRSYQDANAVAKPTGATMPSAYFDELNAKLIANGYRSIRVVNIEKMYMSAIDRDGSEVMLVAHPSNRAFIRETYIHTTDQ